MSRQVALLFGASSFRNLFLNAYEPPSARLEPARCPAEAHTSEGTHFRSPHETTSAGVPHRRTGAYTNKKNPMYL